MKQLLKDATLAAILVFAPIKSTLITVMVLSVVDLVTGVWAARRRGEPISSRELKRTPIKIAVYEIAVLCAYLVAQYLTGPELPIMNLVAGLIGMVELKSILENLDGVSGGPLFSVVTTRLQEMSGSKKDDPK